MTDLSKTIAAKSDQLNSDDLIGGPRTITVTRVTAEPSSAEQPVAIYFEGDNKKPFKPCKTVRRLLVAVWGADGSAYVGRSMTLYREADVEFGGIKVGGIRVSHMSHIDQPMTVILTEKRAGKKRPHTVKPLKAEQRQAPTVYSDLLDAASASADEGSEAYKAFFMALSKADKAALQPAHEGLKAKAAEVDAAKVPGTDDEVPF